MRLIYAEIEGALDRQFEQIQVLNSRAQQLLVFAGGILGLVIALRPPTDDMAIAVLFGFALVLFAAIVGLGYLSWSMSAGAEIPSRSGYGTDTSFGRKPGFVSSSF